MFHLQKDLFEWLNSLNLGEYCETLVKQGFGTLDTVTGITWEDLEEIGIKKLGMNCLRSLGLAPLLVTGRCPIAYKQNN